MVTLKHFCPKQMNRTQLDNKPHTACISTEENVLCCCQGSCTVTIKALAFPVALKEKKKYCTSAVKSPTIYLISMRYRPIKRYNWPYNFEQTTVLTRSREAVSFCCCTSPDTPTAWKIHHTDQLTVQKLLFSITEDNSHQGREKRKKKMVDLDSSIGKKKKTLNVYVFFGIVK